MTHYEYWAHTNGYNYLIRLDEANLVTGVCGPFRHSTILEANMRNYDYDVQPQHPAWVREHASQFHRIDSTSP